jgi:hypothetical protein
LNLRFTVPTTPAAAGSFLKHNFPSTPGFGEAEIFELQVEKFTGAQAIQQQEGEEGKIAKGAKAFPALVKKVVFVAEVLLILWAEIQLFR